MNLAHQYLPHYTYTDYREWQENWELIDGIPYSLMPSPVIRHGIVQSNAQYQFRKVLEQQHNCDCIVLTEIDWRIDNKTVVRPDMMIICEKPQTDFLEFPPILVLEILSPGTRPKDRNLKFELYRRQGVKYYLMADYETRRLESYQLSDNQYKQMTDLVFKLEEGCTISLNEGSLWEQF